MSNNQKLQNNVDYIRCNLRFVKDANVDLFSHLKNIHENARTEECRHLMRLGLMVINGTFNGSVNAKPITISSKNTEPLTAEVKGKSKEEETTPIAPPKSNNLDLGDDLLELGL